VNEALEEERDLVSGNFARSHVSDGDVDEVTAANDLIHPEKEFQKIARNA
jgi:hypothetical protein